MDEILADLIAKYFFQSSDFPRLWRTKKFRTFVHYVLDELYLLKKMDVVHATKPLPSDVIKAIRKINASPQRIRAQFFSENRKEHGKDKNKVLYGGTDIRTLQGLKQFLADYHLAFTHLKRRFEGRLPRSPRQSSRRQRGPESRSISSRARAPDQPAHRNEPPSTARKSKSMATNNKIALPQTQ